MSSVLRSFIQGSFRASVSERTRPSPNPSDPSDIVALVPEGTPEDATAGIDAAQQALPGWRGLTGMARAEALSRWAQVIAGRTEELASAMAREVGKPIAEARGEAQRAVVILRYYAGEAVREMGELIPSQLPDTLQFTFREPLGVIALITPWNFPVAIPLWKTAPALAFGNTVVLKPAEAASQVASLLAETAQQAELPPGVFNVLLGSGAKLGGVLLEHPAVRGVSFTGSGGVGARVAEIASRRNIRYQTEMGGKNAAIVLGDADLNQAATLVAAGAMRYAGQKCTATSRVIVERAIFEPFMAALTQKIQGLSLGPVTDPGAAVGPMIREAERDRVLRFLEAHPARVHTGGRAPREGAFAKGNFLEPTLLSEVELKSPLLTEELFAPVLVAIPVADLEEAIAVANATPYGLSASLFTRSIGSALRYVRRIEAGLVRVNGDTTGVDPHAPFGGMKNSSSGSREQGPIAREFYTEIKTIQLSAPAA